MTLRCSIPCSKNQRIRRAGNPDIAPLELIARLLARKAAGEELAKITAGQSTSRLTELRTDNGDG